MAGMIQSNMVEEEVPGDPTTPDGMPAHENAEPPAMEQQEQAQGPESDDGGPQDEESYRKFMIGVKKVLYETKASDSIARQIAKSTNVPQTLADISYEMVSMVDQKSQGMLPDTMLAAAAFDTLGLITEIGKAIQKQIKGSDVATAAKLMMGRYLKESGADDDELDQLFSGIDVSAAGQMIDQQGAGETAAGE